MAKFNNQDGTLTRYALACGYADTRATDGSRDFYGTDADAVRLSFNGCTYDVRVRIGSRADWHQFDTLIEARRLFRAMAKQIGAK